MGTTIRTNSTPCSVSLYRRQCGQVLPLALAGVVLGFAVLMMLVNTGNRLTEKSRAANIADATALSGATVVAQHLNTMAYLNRASAANHVGAGHMVAYVSWIRYVQEVTERVDDIGQFIPYVGTATGYTELAAETTESLAELAANLYVPTVDSMNWLYRKALDEQRLSLMLVTPIAMNKVASASHDNVKINEAALGDFLPSESALLGTVLLQQYPRIALFTNIYSTQQNAKEGERFSNNTWGNSSDRYKGKMSIPWMTNRDWDFGVLPVKKRGGIAQQKNNGCFNWKASDRLQARPPPSPSWITLASGKAEAKEFHSGYCGMYGVGSLTLSRAAHQVLPITALASISQSDIHSRDVFGLENTAGDGGVTGMAIAQVEFVRPKTNFSAIADDEYANLYNPFWRARLVGSSMKDLHRAIQIESNWRDE